MPSFNLTVFGDSQSGKSSLIRKLALLDTDVDTPKPSYKVSLPYDNNEQAIISVSESRNNFKKLPKTVQKILTSDVYLCLMTLNEKENDFYASSFKSLAEENMKEKKSPFDSVVQILCQSSLFLNSESRLVFVVNKCDGENYDFLNDRFKIFREKFEGFLTESLIDVSKISIVQISANSGENIFERSDNFDTKCSLVDILMCKCKEIEFQRSAKLPLKYQVSRFSVLKNFKIMGTGIVAGGKLLSGQMTTGDEVIILPSMKRATLKSMEAHGKSFSKTEEGGTYGLNLRAIQMIDVPRGSVICKVGHQSKDAGMSSVIEAKIWISFIFREIFKGNKMTLVCQNSRVPVLVLNVLKNLDFETKEKRIDYEKAVSGTFAIVRLKLMKPAYLERFEEFPELGTFVLVDSRAILAYGQIDELIRLEVDA